MNTLGRNSASVDAVNDAGRATGTLYADDNFPFDRAFIRFANSDVKELGTLGGDNSYGLFINSLGHVAGMSQTDSDEWHAFLHKGGIMHDLGAPGGERSRPIGLTNNGQTVIEAQYADGTRRVFIYGVDGTQTHDLNDLVDPTDPLKPYVQLTSAGFRDPVNEFGQIIARGRDSRRSRSRAYLLTPVDSTPPIVKASLTGTKGNNDWFISDVKLRWATTDAEAPIGEKIGCTAVMLANDSIGSLYKCQARSIGGSSPIKAVTIKRDTTKPLAILTTPADGAVYERNQPVNACYRCEDGISGIATCKGTIASGFRIDTSQPVANAPFTITARDQAGLKRTVTKTYTVR